MGRVTKRNHDREENGICVESWEYGQREREASAGGLLWNLGKDWAIGIGEQEK